MRDQRKLTPAAHQLLLCSVSRSQFHTEQANVLHHSNERKLMSYCSSLSGGLFKKRAAVIESVAWETCRCPAGPKPCLRSSIDGVEVRFWRRSQKEKTRNVKISPWHLQGRFVCRGREGVLNQRGVGAIEQTGLSGGFWWSPPAPAGSCEIFPGVSHPASIMWLQCDEDALWATGAHMSGSLGRKVFTRMRHMLNKLGAFAEVSENAEYAESESVSWQRD